MNEHGTLAATIHGKKATDREVIVGNEKPTIKGMSRFTNRWQSQKLRLLKKQ